MTEEASGTAAPQGTALVLGGSIAGLLAAVALSPHARTVTIVERDDLRALDDGTASRLGSAGTVPQRRGVPQGTQVHALLGAGQQAMDELLPGIVEDFVAAGAALLDSPHRVAIFGAHGWSGRVPSRAQVVFMRRPALEAVVRRRVLARSNVTTHQGTATGLTATRGRITGARLRGGDALSADLVVDATGRTSKAADWLAAFGYAAPAIKELRSFVGYATATVSLPEGVFPAGVSGVISHPHPGALRGAAVVPCDNGLYQVAALGMMRADPPKDSGGFLAHLEAAPSPLIAEIARQARIVEEPVVYKVRGSLRPMWEDLDLHPDGLLMLGDSVMSFNPLYGQGMSVAACEAATLARLAAESGLAEGLAARAQAAFTHVVDTVFHLVVSVDAHYEGAELDGISPPAAEAVAFGRALSQLATEDAEVALALKEAGHFFDTTALRAPVIAAKVRDWIAAGRTPRHTDPTSIPPPLA